MALTAAGIHALSQIDEILSSLSPDELPSVVSALCLTAYFAAQIGADWRNDPAQIGASAPTHAKRRSAQNGADAPDCASSLPREGGGGVSVSESFSSFWKLYPKHLDKAKALRAWKALDPSKELQEQILTAVREQLTWDNWLKDGGQFIPYPASWLNGRRWEDERPAQIGASAPRDGGATWRNRDGADWRNDVEPLPSDRDLSKRSPTFSGGKA